MGCGRRTHGEPDASTREEAGARAPGPALRLLVVTDLAGVLEPCSCSEHTFGGIDRLAAALARERADGTPALFLVAGHTFFAPQRGDPRLLPLQERWEAEAIAELLHELGADAALPSAADLRLAGEQLDTLAQRAGFPLLVGVQPSSEHPFAASLRRELGSLRVAVVTAGAEIASGPLQKRASADPSASLARAVQAERQTGADFVIAVAGDGLDAAGSAASSAADLTISAGDMRAEPVWTSAAPGSALLNAGREGRHLMVVDVWQAQRERLGARVVALDRHAPRDPAITRKLRALSIKINQYNATSLPRHPARAAPGQGFAGSEPCAACHTATYLWWQRSAHGRAYATLQKVDKEYNLDCVSCHVTGYGEPGGADVANVAGLAAVGCESCHGRALAHVDNPQRKPRPPRTVSSSTCVRCHDAKHSPDFDPDSYRPRLNGPGHRVSTASTR